MFGLADNVMEVTDGIGYDRLLRLYREIIPIDSELDAVNFANDLAAVCELKLDE